MSLVAVWSFDGTLADETGNANDGSGSVSYAPGKRGRALVGDGSTVSVPVSSSIEDVFTGDELTVSVWWKQTGHADGEDWADIVQYNDTNGTSRRLERGNANNSTEADFWCNFGDASNQLSASGLGVGSGEWFHLAIRRTASEQSAWVNGTKVLSESVSGSVVGIDPNDTLRINSEASGSDIGEIRLYDHALSELEIAQLGRAPVGQWKLNGTPKDSAVYGNDGTAYNGATAAADSVLNRECYTFGGSDDYIDVPYDDAFDVTEEITISAWVRSAVDPDQTSDNDWRGICSRSGSPYRLLVEEDGRFSGSVYVGGSRLKLDAPSSYFSVDTWHHVVYTHVAATGEAEIYVDGELAASKTFSTTGSIDTNTSHWNISEDGTHWNGEISDVRLYATALSSEAVRQLYENRAKLDGGGTLHAHEFVEFDDRRIIDDETFTCDQNDYGSLGTVTPVETDVSDWVESDDTLGNIAIVGEVEVTDTSYVPAEFEYTKTNNDEGFKTSWSAGVVSPEGWQTGWNEFYVPVTDGDYLSPSSTTWSNMDRLQLYRTGSDAGDSNQTIRFRDLRLVKTPDATDSGSFAVGEDGVVTAVEFSETTTLGGSTVVEDAPAGLSVGRLNEC